MTSPRATLPRHHGGPLRQHVRATWWVALLPALVVAWSRGPDAPEVSSAEPALPCVGDWGCGDERQVFVDPEPFGGGEGGEWVAYDVEEVTRAIDRRALAWESEVSLAVRLILGEVGADRLLENQYGRTEALGILFTVVNRLDPDAYDPDGRPGAPVFPGCGPEGSFATCANVRQYHGLASRRALDPRGGTDRHLLADAVDLAVATWWLVKGGLAPDPTGGATSFVHRCGGAAYGLSTRHCDAHAGGAADDDVPGAEPSTGPIVFRGPGRFLAARGHYALQELARVDYRPWTVVTRPDGLADAD